MSKQIHYNIDRITEEHAIINLIFGEKSNRKKLSSEAQKGHIALFRL